MLCDVCQRPALVQCSACAVCFCADHGGPSCFRCGGSLAECAVEPAVETGYYTAERDSHYTGKGYLQCDNRPVMQTIYLDDRGPPECQECGGLARVLCRNCHQLYCREHAASGDLCRNCARSSLVGLCIAAAVLVLFAACVVWTCFVY